VTALEADAHTLKTKLWLAWVIVTAAASAFGAVVSRKLGL
jgi:hypothetical protein